MKLRTRKFLAGLLSLGLLLQAASPFSALAALLVWNTAGRPEPVNTPAFADVADADTAKAAQWCVERACWMPRARAASSRKAGCPSSRPLKCGKRRSPSSNRIITVQ